jgi:outer membrane lipoprotein
MLIGALVACAQSAHQTGRDVFDKNVPKAMRHEVDWSVSYPALLESPSQFEGRTVVLGGIILKSKRTQAGTELEVLQLPLNGGMAPAAPRESSQGRFLAIEPGGLDPASIQEGMPITVVGTGGQPVTRPLDEASYTYPVLEVRKLIAWNQNAGSRYYAGGPYYNYPYYGYYGGGYYGGLYQPYWWGGPYGAPWVPYYFYGPGLATPPPTPPPQSLPPRLRRQ